MAFLTEKPDSAETTTPGSEPAVRPVQIRKGDSWIRGSLGGPQNPRGFLLVAGWKPQSTFCFDLQDVHSAGWATLELELIRPNENGDGLVRFDIPRLARRLKAAVRWVLESETSASTPIGFLCSGNAAAAALWSAHKLGTRPEAIVSVNGRPHLAEPLVGRVSCPTLLLVSIADPRLLHMNQLAAQRLNASSQLIKLESSLPFEERSQAAREAIRWFNKNFPERRQQRISPLSGILAFHLKRTFIALAALSSALLGLAAEDGSSRLEGGDETKLEQNHSPPYRHRGN